jgi:asparagine synthetase B (glutamine-hydrolysing)
MPAFEEGREIHITGLPVLGKRVVSASDPRLATCCSLEDWSRLARDLRGQFAIVASVGEVTFAITDPFGSYPVYYRLDPVSGRYHVAPRSDSITANTKNLSEEGLFTWTLRGTSDTSCLLDGVEKIAQGSVVEFTGRVKNETRYFDWLELLKPRDRDVEKSSFEDWKAEFFDIASSYLGPILRHTGTPACCLSGGIDSALTVASVHRVTGEIPPCFTADYSIGRYSEFAQVRVNSVALRTKLHRVHVGRADHHRAFSTLNSALQDSPHVSAQSSSLLCLAEATAEMGLRVMLTGDHADATFLGFSGLFAGFPEKFEEYEKTISEASQEQKTRWLLKTFAIPSEASQWDEMIISSCGYNISTYRKWRAGAVERERQSVAAIAPFGELPEIQQLLGHVAAGAAWQNLYLGVEEGVRSVHVASIFYDIEMIRFAAALPHPMKYRDGQTKFFLREVLADETGLVISGKRASPNPMRLWMLRPRLSLRDVISPLRPMVRRLTVENLRSVGAHYHEMLKIFGLGLWLQAQDVQISEKPV